MDSSKGLVVKEIEREFEALDILINSLDGYLSQIESFIQDSNNGWEKLVN